MQFFLLVQHALPCAGQNEFSGEGGQSTLFALLLTARLIYQ